MEEMTRTIQPLWATVRAVRTEIGERLVSCSTALRSAAMMTASELLENAIKYGESVPQAEWISFSLQASEDRIRIQVVNGSTNRAGVDVLLARVEELASVSDKSALYLNRLQELISNPEESGRLGLYRIAFEGGFDLSCEYAEGVVKVTAVRDFQ
jgi:hypothetical protein